MAWEVDPPRGQRWRTAAPWDDSAQGRGMHGSAGAARGGHHGERQMGYRDGTDRLLLMFFLIMEGIKQSTVRGAFARRDPGAGVEGRALEDSAGIALGGYRANTPSAHPTRRQGSRPGGRPPQKTSALEFRCTDAARPRARTAAGRKPAARRRCSPLFPHGCHRPFQTYRARRRCSLEAPRCEPT